VSGVSVGGRVVQTRGVTLSAPNSTVWLMGISKCEMRPVTLSRAANIAVSFLIFSAWARLAGMAGVKATASKSEASLGLAAKTASIFTNRIAPDTC